MGVELIVGRANTGKSIYIYDEIKNELDKKTNKNLILLVPEQMTYQSEYEIIDYFKNFGIMDVEILSFKRLAYKVLEEVGGLKIQEINDFGKIMMLKQIFEDNINDLQVFKKASKQDGFLREFDELLKEFKQNTISIEFLKNIKKYNINNELLNRKLSDIIKIYEEVNNYTQDKFYDDEDKINLFISAIEKSNYIKNSMVWIDGFESFYGQRLNIIKGLIKYSCDVSISLNLDFRCLKNLESIPDWEAFKLTYDTYKAISEDLDNEITIIPILQIKNKKPEIEMIEKNILSLNTEQYIDNTDSINIYSSLNPYTETEKAASKIVALVRDNGYRWKDISVAVGDMNSYSINIKKVFTQYEIPYFLDVKRDIMDNPFTKYIMSLLDMFIWNFKQDNVFEYLKTGFSTLNYNEVSKLENFSLQYGIEGHKWFKDFSFNAKKINYYNEMRRKLSDDFSKSRKEFKKLKNALDITLFLFDFIKKHKVQDKIEKQVEVFKQQGMYEKSSECAQVWNYVINIFDQIILAGSYVEISPKEYRKMIEAGFREVKISIIPPTIDKVKIGGIDKISLNKSKALFLMGANEGKLESKNNEKGILLDDERDLLIESGIKLINSSTYTIYKEKHTLYKLFSSAYDKLFISYALGTTEGKSLQPSLYIDKIKEIFPSISIDTDLCNKDEIGLISNKKGTIDSAVKKIRDYIEGREIDNIWKDVYSWYEKNDKRTSAIMYQGIYYNNKVDKINSEYIDKLFKMPLSMSVSKLESFAQCPFKFFMETVLKPQPRNVMKVEFSDLGNIYHRAVEEFTNEITLKKLDIENMTKEDINTLAEMCTGKVLLEKEQDIIALEANERNKYMKEKIKRLVNRAAYTIIKQLRRGSFRTEFTELKIGKTIKLSENQSIYLQGRIDRVDIMKKDDKSFVNIIDYKSSHKDIDLSDAVQGLQLQMLIYMSSIIENKDKLIRSQPEIGGVYYFCIDDPLVDGDNLSNKIVEEEIFSKLSLNGYIVENLDIINNMDNRIDENKTSDIIPVAFNKDGSTKKSSKTLTNDEYKSVLNKTDDVTKIIAEEIINGVIDIKPYKKDSSLGSSTPCAYCDYCSVCQIDLASGNKFRKIKKQSKDEVLFNIMNKGGDTSDGMD